MSSRKRWEKKINIKHFFKKDKFFKSYWIRKTFNKITKRSDLFKCERVLLNTFLNWKKFYLNSLSKKKVAFFVKNSNFNKIKLGLKSKHFLYSFRTFHFRKIIYKRNFFNCLSKKSNKNANKIPKLKLKNFIFFNSINNKKIFFNFKKKPYSFSYKQDSLIPVLVFFKFLNLIKWPITLQSKRFGKYWHKIPTPISFPRVYNYGLRVLGDHLKYSKKYSSFSERLNKEYSNILLDLGKSYFSKNHEQNILTVGPNIPYGHFRWM